MKSAIILYRFKMNFLKQGSINMYIDKKMYKLFIDQPHVYSSIKFEHAQSKDNCNLSIDFNYSGRFPVFFPVRFGVMYICCWCLP